MPFGGRGADAHAERFLRLMEIGTDVLHHGRTLRLLGHEPMSVPDRRAQVEDTATGERFDVRYEELEPAPAEPRGFDPEA